jgi:hypothetical protein
LLDRRWSSNQLDPPFGGKGRLAPVENCGPDEQLALVDQAGLQSLRRQVRSSHQEIVVGRGLRILYGVDIEVAFDLCLGG